MKKIICLLLAAVVLLLSVGCNQQEPKESAETPLEPLFSNTTGLYSPESKEYDNTPYGIVAEDIQIGSFDNIYLYFEDCLKYTTDVVKARFLGTVKKSNKYFFDFEIIDPMKGNFDSKEISVHLYPMNYMGFESRYGESPHVAGYSTYDISYEVGINYLLLLKRIETTFCEKDFLCFASDFLVIPLTSEGKVDINNTKMYGIELAYNVYNATIKQGIQDGMLIEKIMETVRDNPTSLKLEENSSYETDTLKLYDEATYIFIIEPQSTKWSNSGYYSYFGYRRPVNITKVIKGDIDAESFERNITLPTEMKDGEPYLIMLDKNFSILSRSAIFPLSGE